jgi:hypothetical protein
VAFAILAPVPAIFLENAFQICRDEGRVAFGTNTVDVFVEQNIGYEVYIYPTINQRDPDSIRPNNDVCFKGTFDRVTRPSRGVHPESKIRPRRTTSTDDPDTKWGSFWEVIGLQKLSGTERIKLSTLQAAGQKRPFPSGYVLRGPIIIHQPV